MRLWLQMEFYDSMLQRMENHSWESLRQHFLRRILPKIEIFNLDPKIVDQFKSRYADFNTVG